jgi:hypothetical protein
MKKRMGFFALTLLVVLGLASMASAAAVNSGAQSVTLTATASESLTVSLGSNAVTWPAINPGSDSTDAANQAGAVPVIVAWRLANARNDVKVYGYFADANAALAGPNANIPSSAVMIKGGTLGSYTAINGNPPATALSGSAAAGATLLMKTVNITGLNRNGTDTTTYNFALDLSSPTLAQLPSETYAGTLYIEAQTTP